MVRVRVRVSVRLRVIAVLLFKKSQKAELFSCSNRNHDANGDCPSKFNRAGIWLGLG